MSRPTGSTNMLTRSVREIIDSEMDMRDVIGKMFELVMGVTTQEKVGDELVIYTQKPDAYAAKILLEYRYGKPAQTIDLNTRVELLKPQINISKEGGKISLEVKPILEILPSDELPT